ncbi:MAG: DUF4240 domain-containing protein [Proteobacteria bacterium]|nr:MAG: DUF4240 domain-containing protein [Pseudomonadota bacterium]
MARSARNKRNPQVDEIMLWSTIDNLKNMELASRAVELREKLRSFNDQELVSFHQEAVSAFRELFTPEVYHLYCSVYDGEVNDSGLTDFCSNVMLAGRRLFELVSTDPDHFADVGNVSSFNDDYGVDVSEVSRDLLLERHSEDAVDDMFQRAGTNTLDGIWDDLESRLGSLTFEPDWSLVREVMPRVFARFGPNH